LKPWNKIKEEIGLWFEILPKTLKWTIWTFISFLIFFALYEVGKLFLEYYLPKISKILDVESIALLYTLVLFGLTFIIVRFFNNLFKRKN